MHLRSKIILLFVQSYQKGKRFYIWTCHVKTTENDTYSNNKLQLRNHSLSFLHKSKPILLATNILFCSPKVTCIDYVDFGRCQIRFGRLPWSEKDSIYSDIKLKLFRKGDNKEVQLVQKFTKTEGDFNQFMQLRNHLVIAAENFAREENFSAVLIPPLSMDMMNNSNWFTRWLT